MKTTLLMLVAFVAFVTTAHAIVCMPNTCATVRCAAVTAENCNGQIVQNGGFCGCCDACITLLQPGEDCLSLPLLGVPATTRCMDGYYCSPKTSKCEKVPSV